MVGTRRDAQGRFLPKPNQRAPLSQQSRVIISALEQVAESVIKKVGLDISANLSRAPAEGGTPVDTGWARANWLSSVTKSINKPEGSPENVSAAETAKQAGLLGLLTYRLKAGPVFISNNVPYILRLNDGHSKQAPAGFVQRAIQEAVTGLRSL